MDPLRKTWFATGLSNLGIACQQSVDKQTLRVYSEALADQVEPEEWRDFVREAIRAGRYQWLPKVADLLEHLAEYRQRQQAAAMPPPLLLPTTAEEAEANEREIEALKGQRTEAQREAARQGMQALKQALSKLGLLPETEPRSMPDASPNQTTTTTSRATDAERDARLEELRRQAEEVVGG